MSMIGQGVKALGLLSLMTTALGFGSCASVPPDLHKLQEEIAISRADEKSLRGQKDLLQSQLDSVILDNARLKLRLGDMEAKQEELREREALRARDLEVSITDCRGDLDALSERFHSSVSAHEKMSIDLELLKEELRLSKESGRGHDPRLHTLSEKLTEDLATLVKKEKLKTVVANGRLIVAISDHVLFGGKTKSVSLSGRKILDHIAESFGNSSWEEIRAVAFQSNTKGKRGVSSSLSRDQRLQRDASLVIRYLAGNDGLRSRIFSAGVMIRSIDLQLLKGEQVLLFFEPVLEQQVTASHASTSDPISP